MFESDATLLLLAASGLILLRPGDVPLLARHAGRLVGGGVRGLRALRDTTDAALAEGESALGRPGVGKDLRESFSKFDALRTAVTRDVARFAPFDGLTGALRNKTQRPVVHPRAPNTANDDMPYVPPEKTRSLASVRGVRGSAKAASTGVDFIARSIEEAALAEQQHRMFGGPSARQHDSKSPSRPDPLDPPSRG